MADRLEACDAGRILISRMRPMHRYIKDFARSPIPAITPQEAITQ